MQNLISLKTIISKVYSDLGIEESDVPINDMIEWSAEALEKIEAPDLYIQKVTGKEGIPLKKITDYQAQLPYDCKQVVQVAYAVDKDSDDFYPMKYTSGSFAGNYGLTKGMPEDHLDETNLDVVATSDKVYLVMKLYDLSYSEAVEKLNTDEEVDSIITTLLSDGGAQISSDGGTVNIDTLEYKIVPGYIKTNVRSGYLMVSYWAIPLDPYGFPMLPDNQSVIDALFWYIATKVFYLKWVKGEPGSPDLYQHAASNWRFYVKQAYGKLMSPKSLDELESLKNSWNRLIPKINEGQRFFKDTNQAQYMRNWS